MSSYHESFHVGGLISPLEPGKFLGLFNRTNKMEAEPAMLDFLIVQPSNDVSAATWCLLYSSNFWSWKNYSPFISLTLGGTMGTEYVWEGTVWGTLISHSTVWLSDHSQLIFVLHEMHFFLCWDICPFPTCSCCGSSIHNSVLLWATPANSALTSSRLWCGHPLSSPT